MRLLQLIIIILVIWLIYSLLKRYIKNKQINRPDKKAKATQKMIKCEKCSTHVPEGEAIRYKGRYYCSEEHKRLDTSN